MNAQLIGLLSGFLVVASIVPYAIRTYQGRIKPNITSWSLWTLLGLALLLTYRSSGATTNVWPAVFGFTNPLLITALCLWRRGTWGKLNRIEWLCLAVGLLSLGLWVWLQGNKDLVQYALYIAIVADACAAIPTIVFVWTQPFGDRPFAWALFSVGYGLGVFAITEHSFSNYVLPIYMFVGSLSVTFPLAYYRFKTRTPLREWV